MKKTFKNLGKFLMLLILVSSCQEDDKTFGSLDAPTNLEITYEVVGKDDAHPYGDGSGNVVLKATAKGATSYKYMFSDESSANAPSGEYTKQFTQNGVNTYTITAIAYSRGGVATNASIEVSVMSNFSDPEVVNLLTNGTSKVWYWAAATPKHLGVGPNDGNVATNFEPGYYSTAPFEKAASPDSNCLYENKLTFRKDGNFLKFTLDNGGRTFFNAAFNSVGGSSSTSDQCSPYDTSGEKTVSLGPANSVVAPDKTRNVAMTFSDGGFMGYYIGTNVYEIMSITENKMMVRAVMGGNASLAWYHIFTTEPPVQGGGGEEPDFDRLVWSDEFDTPGAPDATKWTAELGTGQSGWGNNELQYYKAENAVVADGSLKITAKAEIFGNRNYTSARLKTEGKFDFTYGRVEIRAKLPEGSGTWPALWMLGANYATNTWPLCGEIDIMEHVGNRPNEVLSTLHMQGNSGGNGITGSTNVPGVSTDFHVYSMIWNSSKIRFLVDGVQFHSWDNNPTSPFNADFFLIFNVAMGGNLGGTIAPGFTQSSMEVDYVRVYQQ